LTKPSSTGLLLTLNSREFVLKNAHYYIQNFYPLFSIFIQLAKPTNRSVQRAFTKSLLPICLGRLTSVQLLAHSFLKKC